MTHSYPPGSGGGGGGGSGGGGGAGGSATLPRGGSLLRGYSAKGLSQSGMYQFVITAFHTLILIVIYFYF